MNIQNQNKKYPKNLEDQHEEKSNMQQDEVESFKEQSEPSLTKKWKS